MPSVTRKPQAKRHERREQIERQLLDATERLMADGASFTELSVDRLATEAGISRASFYIYFEDKGHLLRRLAGQVFADLADAGDRWWSVAGRRDPADARAAISGIVAGYRQHQPLLVALNEMAGYDPQVGAAYREILTAISARFAAVIEQGQHAGSIRRELSAATAANALTWMVERATQQNLPGQQPSFDAELAETLTQIAWAALYLEAP
ncbi:MAG: TetR/AcrR family transcriptional regulator, ethionamide resistance regulator [Mycobacterium sp.]|jgi:AcrR family transcriptional regulator|nr:TetR/AcrR family transcriptional regulator, ethionamide resistance regulator [Mycobacterium sp.]